MAERRKKSNSHVTKSENNKTEFIGGKMRKIFTFLLIASSIVLLNSALFAQNAPIDFESGGNGADWTWEVFENHTNPALEIVANPSVSGINTSATVAKFTALDSGAAYAGCESAHGSDIGTYNLDASNCTIKIMVYKPVASDVGIKLVKPDGWSMGEIKVSNTVINGWEELTFDMSSQIQDGYDQIVIFPDFDAGRSSTNICYFDNITFSEKIIPATPEVGAPAPTTAEEDVISIFSDAYTDIEGTNFNPPWGQSTVFSQVSIAGNNTLLYEGLNYQGTVLGTVQDLSEMGYLHVDFWSPNSSALDVYLISSSTGERPYAFEIIQEEWVSVEIPLTVFTNQGLSINDIKELKFVGNGNVYLDNLYFYKDDSPPAQDDLFFSEYIEGGYNNKALEIYNPTDAAVDLTQYGIMNGDGSGGYYTPEGLLGTLDPDDVYVIVNPAFDL